MRWRRRSARATAPTRCGSCVADYRSGLLDAVPESHLLAAGAINRNHATLEESIKALAINLKKRLPPPDLTTAQLRSRSWWSGPDVVLLVDDWHMIVAAGGVISADGAAGAAAARRSRHRPAHHRDLPDEPGAAGPRWTSSSALLTAPDRPRCSCPARSRTSRHARSRSSADPLARRFSSRRTARRSIQAAYVDPPEEEVSRAPLGAG